MDVEQFIDLVKERPCLYDNRDLSSKNKKVKENNWKEIATVMDINSEVAKVKWKNLKNNYSKHLKGTTATSGEYLKYLHWTWAPNMEFMKKHINFTTKTKPDTKSHQEDNESEYVDLVQSSARSDCRSEEISIANKRQLDIHFSKQAEFLQSTRKQYMENGHNDGYDATDLIFLGYAKAIKNFSIRRQAEIKLKIAKIITDEEVAHYEETSVYPESPVYYSQMPSPQNDPLNPKIVQIKNEES